MMECETLIHSILKRCSWTPITYNQNVSDKYKRKIITSSGISTFLLKHIALNSSRANGSGMKLTVGAYRNGVGITCMIMSTE